MLFAQYMCCSPSMEIKIEETGNRMNRNLSEPIPSILERLSVIK